MKKIKISSAIGCSSLVGVSGKFPFAHGNYCTNSEGYYFVNMWAENIRHLQATGQIDDEIEVILFKSVDRTRYAYAYVVDERVPKEAIHSPYFCGIHTSVEILRWHNEVADGTCLCEVNELELCTLSSRDFKNQGGVTCPECNTSYRVQKQRPVGVYRLQLFNEKSYLPDWKLSYFDGENFFSIPANEQYAEDDIIKIDTNKINEFGNGPQQSNAIPLEEFKWTGVLEKTPKGGETVVFKTFSKDLSV